MVLSLIAVSPDRWPGLPAAAASGQHFWRV